MKLNPNWIITRYLRMQDRYTLWLERNVLNGRELKLLRATIYFILLLVGVAVIMVTFLTVDAVKRFFRNPLTAIYGVLLGLCLPWIVVSLKDLRSANSAPHSECSVLDPLACLDEYKYERYATAPHHESMIHSVLDTMMAMNDANSIDSYIAKVAPRSPVKGYMVMNSAVKWNVDARLMMALMHIDSHFGTQGRAVRTRNPGNVGNNDTGNNRYFATWEEGVDAVAKWLDRNRKPRITGEKVEPAPLGAGSFFFI